MLMRFKPLCVAAITLLAISTGCTPSAARAPAPAASRLGAFRFFERVPDTSPGVTLEGEFIVEPDTILVEAMPGPCHYDNLRSRSTTIAYKCGPDIFLFFDRNNPIERASYSLVATVQVPVTTCARYATTSDGRRVCVQTRTVMVPRDVRRSGRLRPERIR